MSTEVEEQKLPTLSDQIKPNRTSARESKEVNAKIFELVVNQYNLEKDKEGSGKSRKNMSLRDRLRKKKEEENKTKDNEKKEEKILEVEEENVEKEEEEKKEEKKEEIKNNEENIVQTQDKVDENKPLITLNEMITKNEEEKKNVEEENKEPVKEEFKEELKDGGLSLIRFRFDFLTRPLY